MKIEDQVCSLEQAMRLKELGVKQDSYFCWNHPKPTYHPETTQGREPKLIRSLGLYGVYSEYEYYAAFTVAELGEMIPDEYHLPTNKGEYGWWISNVSDKVPKLGSTEAKARATLLIAILENSTTLTLESFNN